jgi:hypothetical protein
VVPPDKDFGRAIIWGVLLGSLVYAGGYLALKYLDATDRVEAQDSMLDTLRVENGRLREQLWQHESKRVAEGVTTAVINAMTDELSTMDDKDGGA